MDKDTESRLKVIQGPTIPESHKRSLFEIPAVLKDLTSSEENDYEILTDTDRRRIQQAKRGGLPITGRIMSNVKHTIDTLVKDDKAMNDLYMRNFLNYLKSRNIDTQMVMADKKTLNRYMREYDISTRPSLHNVVDMILTEVKDILLDNVTKTLQQTTMNEENKTEIIEILKNNTDARRKFIAQYSLPNNKLIKMEDFVFLEWFFSRYGLSNKDQIFFHSNSKLSDFFDQEETLTYDTTIGNTYGDIDFDEYKETFLLETGYDFHEVYLYYAQKYKDNLDKEVVVLQNTAEDAPTGLNNSIEYFVPSNRASAPNNSIEDIIISTYNDDDVIFE